MNKFNTLIVITPNDFKRISQTYHHMINNLPSEKLIFIGSSGVESLINEQNFENKVDFLNENDVLSFDKVHECIKKRLAPILNGQELPGKVTGWYYQQFLKMQYYSLCNDEYYMTWDGDTVPCAPFSMFKEETGQPYIDVKTEYHEDYFKTIETLFPGMHKCIGKSFISEHMLFKKDIMCEMIECIEQNNNIEGTYFYEKIINAIPVDKLQSNSFSEFETYGTYLCFTNPSLYRLRNWPSFRMGGYFFDPNTICERDYKWLSKNFYAISFEKSHKIRDDYKNLFDNEDYQQKMSARQMFEIAQEEFEGGMKEIWDSQEDDNVTASFIIPCYNSEKYLRECLDSIISQTYLPQSYEIVAIDDCSTDNTLNILKEYESLYSESILLIPLEEHLGLPGIVRNIALSYSHGNFIVFLDSDDYLDSHFLEVMIDKIQSTNCDFVTCGFKKFKNTSFESDTPIEASYKLNDTSDRKKLILNEGTRTSVWGRIYRRSFLLENKIHFSENYHIAEDMYFWHHCMLSANASESIKEDLYYYRDKDNSIFHDVKNNYAFDLVNCIKELSIFFNMLSSSDEFREEYNAVVCIKGGNELLYYLESHDTSDELYSSIIYSMRQIFIEYWPKTLSNRYLNEKELELIKLLLA